MNNLLRRGISIVAEQVEAADCPVQFSSGSMGIASPLYEAGAIVPRGPWSAIAASELRELADPQRAQREGNSIKIVEFPATLLHRFHELLQGSGEPTRESLAHAAGSPVGRAIFLELSEHVRSAHGLDGTDAKGNIHGGFCLKGRDLETVTTNPTNGLCVGLHVDNWFRLPLGLRAEAPGRFCANFGWNDRFFLFLNISLDDLANGEIGEFAEWADEQIKQKVVFLKRPTALAREFLTAFPDYPIGKLRVRPGEAYLAPTENLVHDGSSLSSTMIDISCHINGQRSDPR